MKKKVCCILYNQPGNNALPDETDVLNQVEYVAENLGKLGLGSYRKGITDDFMREISLLAGERPDFVFNLVESINNKGELCYFIPALLNMYSIPYTGNSLEALFVTTSKSLSNQIMEREGIKIPATYYPSQFSKLEPGKPYIIKPVWEDGSLGITKDSVFTYMPGYERNFEGKNDSHWIIQEYVDGREFNISILSGMNGPEVMPAAEMIFHNFDHGMPKIVDFRAKWIEESFEYKNTVREFPHSRLDPMLREKIDETALKCWNVFGLRGYARVDLRVDQAGNPLVIEVNANPCISPDSGLVAATIEAGIPMTEVISRIISDLNY